LSPGRRFSALRSRVGMTSCPLVESVDELIVDVLHVLPLEEKSTLPRVDHLVQKSRYFGTTPQFWLNLQAHYNLDLAEDELAEEIEQYVHPRSAAPPRAIAIVDAERFARGLCSGSG
jgi:hypothetical protein